MAVTGEIGWDQLDMRKFAVGSTLMFLGTRTIVYPFSLVKTRLQVQEVRRGGNLASHLEGTKPKLRRFINALLFFIRRFFGLLDL